MTRRRKARTASSGKGFQAEETSKVRIRVVDVGRSGRAEYAEYTQGQVDKLRSTVIRILRENMMPTAKDFVETVFSASLACHYWRTDLDFAEAVEQVVSDIQRAVERG